MKCKKVFFSSFPLLIVIFPILSKTEVPRPLGVSLSRAALYNPDTNFLCFDNSKTIPFSQVNDDYCDCPDASDEPGTSACPHGTFHCTNAGHKPLNIASSRVNDGICDCCDGTDEYAEWGAKCSNICLELGREAREEAQRQAEMLKAGVHIKNEMSQRGVQLKMEKKNRLTELENTKAEAERVKEEKKAIKDEVETRENKALEFYRQLEEEQKKIKAEAEAAKNRQEAEETFKRLDSNQDGRIDISELQARQTFDKDRNGEVTEEEAKFFFNDETSVDLEQFVQDVWSNVKPYLMMESGLFKPPRKETGESDGDEAVGEAEDMQTNEHEVEEEVNEQDGEEDEEDESNQETEDNNNQEQEETEEQLKYDEETQKIVEEATAARNDYSEAETAVRNIEKEITNIGQYLEKDFGPDEEYATLEGECFKYEDHEYIYTLCPFDKATQQQKSGGIETRLGVWGRWSGPQDNIYETMLYDRGQTCWNGPQRSTTVKILCGVDNKVTSVSEPNRCEYLFYFTTPAACRDSFSENNSDDIHDEL